MSASDRMASESDDRRPLAGAGLRADEPMTDELCVFLLSLDADGRALPSAQRERALAWAEAHPTCRATLADFAAIGEALRELPVPRARPGFAERVLAARTADAGGTRILLLARRMAVAAALLLAATVVVDTTHPRGAVADPDVTVERHAVDALQPRPFGEADLDAGLVELLPDPARRSSGRVAATPTDDEPADDAVRESASPAEDGR